MAVVERRHHGHSIFVAGGGDDLIGIFDNAQRTYPATNDADQAKKQMNADLCQRLANLTRRDPAAVQ